MLNLPREIVDNHILSLLDPKSLYSALKVNKEWYKHISSNRLYIENKIYKFRKLEFNFNNNNNNNILCKHPIYDIFLFKDFHNWVIFNRPYSSIHIEGQVYIDKDNYYFKGQILVKMKYGMNVLLNNHSDTRSTVNGSIVCNFDKNKLHGRYITYLKEDFMDCSYKYHIYEFIDGIKNNEIIIAYGKLYILKFSSTAEISYIYDIFLPGKYELFMKDYPQLCNPTNENIQSFIEQFPNHKYMIYYHKESDYIFKFKNMESRYELDSFNKNLSPDIITGYEIKNLKPYGYDPMYKSHDFLLEINDYTFYFIKKDESCELIKFKLWINPSHEIVHTNYVWFTSECVRNVTNYIYL